MSPGQCSGVGEMAGLGVGGPQSRLVLPASTRDKTPTLGSLVVGAAVQLTRGVRGRKKGTFTSKGRCFLTLAVKLMPALSTAGRMGSLCVLVGMAPVGSCVPRHPGAVGEEAFALPWPRVTTILCSVYSHVPTCRW